MKRSHVLCFLLLLFTNLQFAQNVETVAGPNPRVNNGIVVDENGEVFASDLFGSGFNGSRVYKISPSGDHTLYASGLSQPAGLALDENGILYVAEFTSGEISAVDASGNVNQWVTGLNQPADLVFDQSGNLYVTNYGNGVISKISPDGIRSTFATGLSLPVGLSIDENDQLYSANLGDGKIYRIDSGGNKTLLTTVEDTPIGFMTYSFGFLYVTSTGGNRVYKVSLDGTVSPFAGTGIAGEINGDAHTAQFTNPDGIAISPTGDSLYVSENNSNLLRRIVLGASTGASQVEKHQEIEGVTLVPNPSITASELKFKLNQGGQIEVMIYASSGVLLKTIWSGHLIKGEYAFPVSLGDATPGIYYCQLKGAKFIQVVPVTVP